MRDTKFVGRLCANYLLKEDSAPWILQLLFEAPLIFSWATFTGPKLASPLRLQSQSQICALQTGLRVALALTTPILQNSTDCFDINE